MEDKQIDDELNQWFSTYGVITAERILGTYQIIIPQSELLVAIKSPFSFYHQILQVPLRNVLNGIVLQQANDYHVYAQKLFIDYLLSGETSKGEEAQGALTRESLENERTQLVTLGDEFHHKQLAHDALIASSQSVLRKIAKEWGVALESGLKQANNTLAKTNIEVKKSLIRRGVTHALIHCDLISSQSLDNKYLFIEKMNEIIKAELTQELKERLLNNFSELLNITMSFNSKVSEFFERAVEMSEQARSYRTQFFDTIIRITELFKLLPEYKIDPVQDAINREPLYFDKTIGEA
ncbi:hypothetical protein [Legionella maioricensis]|uniref:Uncharacterized protein n=1 Tax=Legionella maioricensis TaxID=2896528 RepID=A0A9X2ICA0_9GAMM|nr:hypothetical protein [Legionella maioricensis]MCL9685026.1 hypothetical protein [Legionella maioricensis]MCL9688077.1 hypothetical protein [Legionella maioricensis]